MNNYDDTQAVNNISEDMKLKIRDKYHRIIAEIAFSDEPFSDEEIRLSLKKVENELNIYLNE